MGKQQTSTENNLHEREQLSKAHMGKDDISSIKVLSRSSGSFDEETTQAKKNSSSSKSSSVKKKKSSRQSSSSRSTSDKASSTSKSKKSSSGESKRSKTSKSDVKTTTKRKVTKKDDPSAPSEPSIEPPSSNEKASRGVSRSQSSEGGIFAALMSPRKRPSVQRTQSNDSDFFGTMQRLKSMVSSQGSPSTPRTSYHRRTHGIKMPRRASGDHSGKEPRRASGDHAKNSLFSPRKKGSKSRKSRQKKSPEDELLTRGRKSTRRKKNTPQTRGHSLDPSYTRSSSTTSISHAAAMAPRRGSFGSSARPMRRGSFDSTDSGDSFLPSKLSMRELVDDEYDKILKEFDDSAHAEPDEAQKLQKRMTTEELLKHYDDILDDFHHLPEKPIAAC